ncbi:transporter permease [Vallitalea okinawensis]|uniref:hypothetical protein n=1 Tax=Vallitalea okinawensis TaxID=2078660 RepID=UPI000CFC7348|nr:hypothetical protein [Vallitalea okinawensis]
MILLVDIDAWMNRKGLGIRMVKVINSLGNYMRGKWNGFIWLLIISISFYMCLDTKYVSALGDSIIERIGLKSWSAGDKGLHLTVLYFGVIIITGLFVIEKSLIIPKKIKRWKAFMIFVLLVSLSHLITTSVLISIKSNSPGVLSVGFDKTSEGYYEIEYNGDKLIDFDVKLELRNYSDEDKQFSIQFEKKYKEEHSKEIFTIYDKENNIAVFSLEARAEKIFEIDPENYYIEREQTGRDDIYSSRGSIQEVMLINKQGDSVRLHKDNFLGEGIEKQ